MTGKFLFGGDAIKIKATANEGNYVKSLTVEGEEIFTNDDASVTETTQEVVVKNVWPTVHVAPREFLEVTPSFDLIPPSLIDVKIRLEPITLVRNWSDTLDGRSSPNVIFSSDFFNEASNEDISITLYLPETYVGNNGTIYTFSLYDSPLSKFVTIKDVKENNQSWGTNSEAWFLNITLNKNVPAHSVSIGEETYNSVYDLYVGGILHNGSSDNQLSKGVSINYGGAVVLNSESSTDAYNKLYNGNEVLSYVDGFTTNGFLKANTGNMFLNNSEEFISSISKENIAYVYFLFNSAS